MRVQEKATFEKQKDAQTVRIDLEKARRTADMQAELAKAQVSVDINRARAAARKAEADGEAAFVRVTGEAEGSRRRAIGLGDAAAVEALGLAKAQGYQAQVESLGSGPTAAIAVASAVSEGKIDVVPEVLVTGGGGAIEGLAAAFMRTLNGNGAHEKPASKPAAGKS